MLTFIARRLLSLLPTLWLSVTLVFFLVRLAPGGPFDQERAVPPEVLAALEAKYRLSDPVWVQYKDWLADLVLRGSLGPTFKYPNRTVNEIIALSLPVSIQLGLWSAAFAILLGVPLGVVSAVRRNTWVDAVATAAALVGLSIPRFVLAPVLVMVFALGLTWLPAARFDTWRHMVLPVFCGALPMAAHIARLARAGMLEVTSSDFVRTARAKGLTERRIVVVHALRGGLLPVVSYLGPGFSGLLVGSLVLERIFDIPGMGRYFIEAFQNRDYNLVAGLAVVYGVILMVSNAVVDIAYAYLDPRVELDR